MSWTGKWFAGTLPSGDMVFVNAEGASARDAFEDHAFEVADISDLKKLSNDELLAELTA
jgi:hypothetical protein